MFEKSIAKCIYHIYIYFFYPPTPAFAKAGAAPGTTASSRCGAYICSLQMPQCFAAASPQAFVVRAFKPAVCLHGPLFLGRSSLPFASRQTLKILRGSFDQALWPQAFVLRGLQPAVYLHGPLDNALWPQAFVLRALQPAVCLHGPLFLGRSNLPFASRQKLKILHGSFDHALWPRHSGHRPLFFEPCSLPFASMALCSYRAFKPAVCQPSKA